MLRKRRLPSHRTFVAYPALVCLALTALAAGCGDGGSQDRIPSLQTKSDLSHGQLVSASDRICKRFRMSIRDLKEPSSAASPSEIGVYLKQLAEAGERTANALSTLPPSSADRPAFRKYLDQARTQIQLIRRAADEFASGNTEAGTTDVRAVQQAGPTIRALAQGFGFRVCGSTSG
jgi:hypothetical protein